MNIPARIRPFAEDCRIAGVGFAMGSANVIPGVSGGTMAFILGIFGELVEAISLIASVESFRLLCKGEFRALFARIRWRFLIALGFGILLSFATMAKLFVWLLDRHEQVTYAFFFGLIAASVITVNRQMGRWSASSVIAGLFGVAIAYGVISLVPVNTPENWYVMFLCGVISIIAMILPGLSGSFLLLLLGQYNYIWGAVSNVSRLKFNGSEIVSLCWFALGCAVGLGSFVHLLNYLMRRFRNQTIAVLIGFMIGSLPRIWPWQHAVDWSLKKGKPVVVRIACDAPKWDISLLWVLLAAGFGLALVLLLEYAARGRAKTESAE